MFKAKLPAGTVVDSVFQTLITSTHPLMPKDTKHPETNTSIVFNQIYKTMDHLGMEFSCSAFADWSILLFLNQYRYPNIEGNVRSDRLLFDFTTIGEHLGAPKDISSFALYFNHPKTLNCLLQEEQFTWNNEEQIIKGLDRTLEPNGFTWLHKYLLLGQYVHNALKNSTSFQLELKEFLQNTMQVFVDLLGKYPPIERSRILKNIAALLFRMLKDKVITLLPVVFPLLILQDILEKSAYRELLSILSFDKEKEMHDLIKTYGLDASSLLVRKQLLTQLQKDLDEGRSDAPLDYLKIRFNLAFVMSDRILFQQCMGNASVLNTEALIESMYFLLRNTDTFIDICFFLEALPKELRRKTVDYLFLKHSSKYASISAPSTESPQEKKVNPLMLGLLFSAISSLGTINQRYDYIQALIKTAVTHKLVNLCEHLVLFLRQMDSPLSDENLFLKLKDDSSEKGIPKALAKYPALIGMFTGKCNQLHKKIIQSIEKAERNCLNEKGTWIVYLSLMHLSLLTDVYDFQSKIIFSGQTYFQVLEYWLDQLIANKSKYPSLWGRMQAYLLETDFFSDPRLKYLFTYRFGAFCDIGQELENTRDALGPSMTDKSLMKLYGDKLTRYLKFSENEPLGTQLELLFQSKKGQVDARVDFVRCWVSWAESQEEKLNIKQDKYKISKAAGMMLETLINQTPIAALIAKLPEKPSSSPLFLSEHLDLTIIDCDKLIDSLVFDTYSSEMFFVLLLFLNKSEYKFIHSFMMNLTIMINTVCEQSPAIKEKYTAFYEVMAKNKFFQQELDYFLIKTFYISNLVDRSSLEKLVSVPDLDTQKTLSTPKKDTKKKKHPKAKSSIPESEKTLETTADEASSIPNLIVPIVEAKNVQPPSLVQKETGAESLPCEEISESHDSSSDGGSTEEAEDNRETTAQKAALRKAQQQIYLIFKNLITWSKAKIDHLGAESLQAIQYNELIKVLESNQNLLRKIRTLVKRYAVDPSLPQEPELPSLPPLEHLQHYPELVLQMKELSTQIKGAEEITSLIDSIVLSTPETLLQMQLLEHLMLPEMPVIKKIASLFSEHAKIFISGSSLFLSNPTDIDFRLEMKDETLSIEAARALFESTIMDTSMKEGLGFEIIFQKLMIGIASITIKAKGDGYGLQDYKSMDFTLLVADPSKRLAKLDHTSHTAAKINVLTGIIDCKDEDAHAIIRGVFSLHPVPIADPSESYKKDVHILTTLMRAWSESKLRPLRLDESALSLMGKIKTYQEEIEKLRKEDPSLDKALRGMIIRHFKHFEYNNTYAFRTSMIINFLSELGMLQLLPSTAQEGLFDLFSNELRLFKEGLRPFFKTECFLRFCVINPIIHFDHSMIKESLIKILSKHFSHHKEGIDYLQKTQALLDLCQRIGFNISIRDKIDSHIVCCHLQGVNFLGGFILFSAPLLSTDYPNLLIIEAPRLLDSNNRALITAEINRRLYAPLPIAGAGRSGFFSPPALTTLTEAPHCTPLGCLS